MTRFPFAHTRTNARAQRPQPALDLALAPVVVLAEGVVGALERGRRFARRLAVRAMHAEDYHMPDAIGRDRARIVRAVLARERIEAAWFPGDPL